MNTPNRRLRICILWLLTSLAVAASPAAAVDIWVTRYDDPTPGPCLPTDCSLREALLEVMDTDVPVNRIFLSAGTYEVTLPGSDDDGLVGDLDVHSDHIEIIGAGANLTTVDGNAVDRVFDVDVFSGTSNYLFQGFTITGGKTLGAQHAAAIRLLRADLILRECEVVGNVDLIGGEASAVEVSLFGHLQMERSTIAGNTGHGIVIQQATLTMENSTLSGNSAREIRGMSQAEIVIRNSTIFGVDAFEVGLASDDFPLQIGNSIVVGGCSLSFGATLDSLGGNVESPGHSCTFGGADIDDVGSILLGSLGANGGPTRTHLPQIASPVVGAGNDANNLEIDQRGGDRPATGSDSGAVEWLLFRPHTPLFIDGFGQGDAEAWSNF